jgi:fumarylacetoacetate (FAA) hydrolase family protein
MPDIQDVLDVTFNELSSEQQLLLKEAMEQFQQKCLMSFSKNRSGVPFLKSDMPRVLMPGETDATTAAENQEAFGMIQQTMEEIMARHNTAFLSSIRQMMVGVFGPGVDKHFEQGDSSVAAAGQPSRQDASVQPPP